MSYNCSVCNKERPSFNVSNPDAYCQCTLNRTHLSQIGSADTMGDSQSAFQGFSQSFTPAFSYGNYWPNHYLTNMEEPYLLRNDGPALFDRLALTSPTFTSMSSGYPIVNSYMAEPFYPRVSQGFPSYTSDPQESYSFNAQTNAGYSQLDSGLPQHSVSATHSGGTQISSGTARTSEKAHACPSGCGKSFRRKGDMERHARVHSASTLWCHVAGCNRGFYRKDKLDEHVMRKHPTH